MMSSKSILLAGWTPTQRMIVKSSCLKILNPQRYCQTSTQGNNFNEELGPSHVPVLLAELLDGLRLKSNGVYLDFTFGAGGHTKKILESFENTRVYGVDRDPTAYNYGLELQKKYPNRFFPVLGKFSEMPLTLKRMGVKPGSFDGVLLDAGVSTMQFSEPGRGFMLSKDGPLDMRMDQDRIPNQPTAAQILHSIDEFHLGKVLKFYGQEKRAKLIARMIVTAKLKLIDLQTTQQLADLISHGLGDPGNYGGGVYSHPATKTFQALRILVNDELNELDYAVKLAHYYLAPNGIFACIGFHSLEQTIVKRHISGIDAKESEEDLGVTGIPLTYKMRHGSVKRATEQPVPWESLTKHAIIPTDEEILMNKKARSAQLRIARKNSNFIYE